jgi:predicted dithiol-disulfide oxidoreductase (DUF899 family)
MASSARRAIERREEKEASKRHDELSRRKRALPWVKVKKPGDASLADLFGDHNQLFIKHS